MLLATGLNHASAGVALRERVAFARDNIPQALVALQQLGCEESLILSTCNRTEVYALAPEMGVAGVQQFLRQGHGLSPGEVERHFYAYTGLPVADHLFRVAASLDSMVLGEAEILGQVKEAYDLARAAGSAKKILNGLFQRSFAVAKRVRTETSLGELPVSVASVAVGLVRRIFPPSESKTVLLLGAGQVAEAALRHFKSEERARIIVCSRSLEHASSTAATYAAESYGLEDLGACLERADVVLCSLAVERTLISREMLAGLKRPRRGRPIFFIDLGVPRNVEAGITEMEDVYLYDMDDLQHHAAENIARREKIRVECEPFIASGVREFETWWNSLDHHDLIGELKSRGESLILAEHAKTARKLQHLSPADHEEILHLCRRLLGKALHHPIRSLKAGGKEARGWRHFFFGDEG